MIVFVTEHGSDYKELYAALREESVSFQATRTESVRELGGGSYTLLKVEANLPEVKVPAAYTGTVDARALRLPSGRLIITDMEGSLEQIAPPVP
jgi:hypothetical protein